MPNDDLVVAKAENADSASGILAGLLDGGFAALLDDKDIKHACLKELADVGCRAPANHVVWFCVRKLASAAEGFASETLKSKFIDILEANPTIAGVLRRISNLKSAEKDKNTLKQRLLEDLNATTADDAAMMAEMTTELEVVAALHTRSALQGLPGKIADLAKEIGATLETVLRDMTEPRLLTAGADGNWERSGRIDSVLERLTYTSGLYGFHGREDEFALLGNFLSQIDSSPAMNRFSWLLLTGPGGEGKSRLALEFCKNHVPTPWNAGKLGFEELKALTGGPFNWRPRRPTLFVIDYPAQAPEAVNKLLRMLDRDWKEFDLPVRVLLLERDIKGEWFKQFLGGDSASHGLLDHVFDNMREGYPVPPLAPEAIITLMKERFKSADLEPPPNDQLLFAAWKIDSRSYETDEGIIPLPRALFASAVAETLIETIGLGDVELGAVIESLDRNDIFDDLIERERQTRWRPACGHDLAKLECHENLLAFATMCLALPRSTINKTKVKSLRGDVLPSVPDWGLLQAMGSSQPDSGFAAIEPDILGEHFALSRLQALHKAGQAQDLIDAGFEIGGEDFAIFCLRCLNDFPQHTKDLELLFPSENVNQEGARLFVALLVDLTSEHYDKLEQAERARLAAMTKLFQNRHSSDPVLALREAMAAVNVTNHAGVERDWAAIDEVFTRLEALRGAFPDNIAIAEQNAMAAVNITNHAGAARQWLRADAMVTRLDSIRAAFPDDPEIALRDAMAAVNVAGRGSEAGDWTRVDTMINRLDAVRTAFPNDPRIAAEDAKVAVNLANHAGAVGEWRRVEVVFARLNAVRTAFPDDSEIALLEAGAIANAIGRAGEARDWALVDAMFDRLDTTRTAFPDHAEIAQQEGRAVVNAISHAGNGRNWAQVSKMNERAELLFENFLPDREIVRICGYAFAQRYCAFRRAGQLPNLYESTKAAVGAEASINWSLENGSMIGVGICSMVIKDLCNRFPDNEEISAIYRRLEDTVFNWDQVPPIQAR